MIQKMLLLLLTLTALFAENSKDYVGDKSCVECHQSEFKAWKGSHHDLAMMEANEDSVKADFNNTTFNYNGIISSFYKKDGKFMVETDGPDGKLHTYEISYTFGIYPLQQYMIKFPGGRLQVLDPTWDNRSKAEGGQRWYHIHKDDNVTAGDPLHWTGPNMNWNYMCADCHSTNLKKNYDVEKKEYHTTWDSINVSCEACHGPAASHLSWVKNKELNVTNKGFPLTLTKPKNKWRDRNATLKSYIQKKELDVCAKCHSRRSQLDDDFVAGNAFHDHYLPVGLEEGLYFPDGKIEDEVYVYNSFLQSEMYAQGVTCSDCHDAHSLERKGVGDKVCFSCHQSATYTAPTHHKHKTGSKGASCISCHMPARTYMGVDSRNDHSFRVPRPDVSMEHKEVPNACNLCHTDKDATWATDAMKKWYGEVPVGKQNFSHALSSLRSNAVDAPKSLYSVLTSDAPKIAKATVTTYLGNYPTKQTYTTTLQMLRNSDPMVRRSALMALEAFPLKLRIKETFKMLEDSVSVVRLEAARQLSSLPMGNLEKAQKEALTKALNEYKASLLFTAERPETQLSLARLYTVEGKMKKAKEAYVEALRLQPMFVPAYINYSHFLQTQGKELEAKEVLENGIKVLPKMAMLHHTLGLWYVRAKESKKAEVSLKHARDLDKNNARFSYVYAISLGAHDAKAAIVVLEEAYARHQGDMSIVSGLAYYYKQVGNVKKSEMYEKKVKALQNFSVR
ncbi:MAG: hypothetical protein GQ531_02585 [Sulfurovum sp.]|nr:hypothetical protein [Sulfurovum sp.]